jgi:hypothetical protein
MTNNSAEAMKKCIDIIGSIRMEPWTHANRIFTKNVQTGYVFAIGENGTNNTYIGWSGTVRLNDILTKLQYGNARKLYVISVLQRSNVYDATVICNTFRSGLLMYKIRKGWYTMEHINVQKMFKGIDVIKKESNINSI